MPADCIPGERPLPGFQTAVSSRRQTGLRESEGAPWCLFTRLLMPSRGPHPHDLRKTHLQVPSLQGLGLQHMNLGDISSVLSTARLLGPFPWGWLHIVVSNKYPSASGILNAQGMMAGPGVGC